MMQLSTSTGHSRVRYLNEDSLALNTFKPHLYFDFSEFIIPKTSFIMNNKQKSNKNCSCKMVKKTKEFEINFWRLSTRTRFIFDKNFTKKLFDSCKKDFYDLASELKISYSYLIHLRNSKYSIPSSVLLQISRISTIPLEEIQKQIQSTRSRAGNGITIPFPIKPIVEIASLVGHIFGDGHIGSDRRYFEYSNNNQNLIKEVKNQIFKIFGIKPTTEKKTRITYPTIIGEILEAFGAPVAPKIQSQLLIPRWIFSSEEYKIAFLKAFFDDDGSVMYSNNYNAKGLNLHITRYSDKKEEALELLNQIHLMLKEFSIITGKPRVSRTYTKKDGERVVCYINITNYQSLINFHKNIGLTDGNKSKKLRKIVKKYYNSKDGEVKYIVRKPKKVLVLGSGALKEI